MSFDGKAFGVEIVGVVKGFLAKELAPIAARLNDLEERINGLPTPVDLSSDLAALKAAVDAIEMPEIPATQIPDIGAMVRDAVDTATASLPVPMDGKDADPSVVVAMVREQIKSDLEAIRNSIPVPPELAKLPELPDIPALVAEAVSNAIAAVPAPKDGRDADPAEMRSAVELEVQRAVSALPPPRDGQSVTLDDVRPMIEGAVAKATSSLPLPRDGVGLASMIIDRDGCLNATMTDGAMKNLGPVVGRDGSDVDMAAVERSIAEKVAAVPVPKDGADGLGFDDLSVEYDGEKCFTMKFCRGEQTKEFSFVMPVVIDRGVYREGRAYKAGDGVTWAGSFWIAQKDTVAKPDAEDDWRLSVKRGRDGRNAEHRAPSAIPPVRAGLPAKGE